MRIVIALALLAAAAVPGCAAGPSAEDEAKRKQELEALRLEMNQKIATLEQRYASVLQMEQKVKNAVEEAQKLTKVNDVVRGLLTAQEQTLKDQLRTVQELLKGMQKP